MRNSIIVALRREYDALLLVADGLLDMIYSHDACNVLTLSRMASEARAAARHLASEIERLIFELRPAPVKSKPTFGEKVCGFLSRMANALIGKQSAFVA